MGLMHGQVSCWVGISVGLTLGKRKHSAENQNAFNQFPKTASRIKICMICFLKKYSYFVRFDKGMNAGYCYVDFQRCQR